MSKIFISYRREDSSAVAQEIADVLRGRFGIDNVVIDVDSIMPGMDFYEKIQWEIEKCSVMLAIIGPKWSDSRDPENPSQRRLNDPDDVLRYEIASGLKKQLYVIPTLVLGARLPNREELPKDLQGLRKLNAVDIPTKSESEYASQIAKLVQAIRVYTIKVQDIEVHTVKAHRARIASIKKLTPVAIAVFLFLIGLWLWNDPATKSVTRLTVPQQVDAAEEQEPNEQEPNAPGTRLEVPSFARVEVDSKVKSRPRVDLGDGSSQGDKRVDIIIVAHLTIATEYLTRKELNEAYLNAKRARIELTKADIPKSDQPSYEVTIALLISEIHLEGLDFGSAAAECSYASQKLEAITDKAVQSNARARWEKLESLITAANIKGPGR